MNRLNRMVSPYLLDEDIQECSRVGVVVVITKIEITENVNINWVHEHTHLLEFRLPCHQTLIQQCRLTKYFIHRSINRNLIDFVRGAVLNSSLIIRILIKWADIIPAQPKWISLWESLFIYIQFPWENVLLIFLIIGSALCQVGPNITLDYLCGHPHSLEEIRQPQSSEIGLYILCSSEELSHPSLIQYYADWSLYSHNGSLQLPQT